MNELIEAIKKFQSLKGLSDTQFCRRAGIDLSTWSKIKNGKANPGGKFLRAVSKSSAFPELRMAVFDYLTGG